MNAEQIAQIIADYLIDRDDIADTSLLAQVPGVTFATIGVETQGGERYFVNVEPA